MTPMTKACRLFGVACLVAAGSTATPILADSHGKTEVAKLNVGGTTEAGGVIKGVVKFAGKQKAQKKLRVDADPVCAAHHGGKPLLKEMYVFGKNDTLQNVFVYVSKGLEKKKFIPPAAPVKLDQLGCRYVPHVSGIVIGQTLEIHNSDATAHNVKLNSKKNGRENRSMTEKGAVITRTFRKAELPVEYKCDVHPWMGAYLHVLPHPFFAVTQGEGTFEIRGLPPGDYEISVWHEFKVFRPEEAMKKVTVVSGETVEVEFTYAPRRKKK